MIIEYRQKARHMQPGGPFMFTASLFVCGLDWCESIDAHSSSVDEFRTVTDWREAIRLGIECQRSKIDLFSGMPDSERYVAKAKRLLGILLTASRLPDSEIEYQSSHETYVVESFLSDVEL